MSNFKWAGVDDAERLLGVWVTPYGNGLPTWEKARGQIMEKLTKWQLKHLTILARKTVVNSYITPLLAFQAQVYPPPAEIWVEISHLLHGFTSGNRAATAKGFILWSKDLLYTPRADGGIGVRDPEVVLSCPAARRVGLFLTELCPLKKDIMVRAAGLPLGAGSFTAHEKLLKHSGGRSIRWKQASESFMRSPFCFTAPVMCKGDVLQEILVFNKSVLLKGTAPVGCQKDATGLWDTRFGDLLEAEDDDTMVLKAMAVLSQQIGGSGPAKLATMPLLETPVPLQRWLGFPTVLPCSAGSPSLLNILENGQVISMKRLKEGWKWTRSQTYKQEKWAARWGRHINWKWVVATRDSLAVPTRPRDVLIHVM